MRTMLDDFAIDVDCNANQIGEYQMGSKRLDNMNIVWGMWIMAFLCTSWPRIIMLLFIFRVSVLSSFWFPKTLVYVQCCNIRSRFWFGFIVDFCIIFFCHRIVYYGFTMNGWWFHFSFCRCISNTVKMSFENIYTQEYPTCGSLFILEYGEIHWHFHAHFQCLCFHFGVYL